MKKLLLIIGFMITLFLTTACVKVSPVISVCELKEDLNVDDLTMFDETGIKYINDLNEGKLTEKDLSSIAKTQPEFQDPKLTQVIKQQFGSFKDPKLIEIFRVKKTSASQILCTNDLSNKKNKFLVSVPKDVSDFVMTIHEVSTDVGNSYFVNLLVYEDNIWKLRALTFQLKELNKHSADYFIDIANKELEKGNKRNAVLILSIGQQLLINNFLVKTEYISEINEKINSIDFENIPQTEPEKWTIESGTTLIVYAISAHFTVEEVGLKVNYITSDLNNQEKINLESEQLADYIIYNFPEYATFFDGIVTIATEKIPLSNENVDSHTKVYAFDK